MSSIIDAAETLASIATTNENKLTNFDKDRSSDYDSCPCSEYILSSEISTSDCYDSNINVEEPKCTQSTRRNSSLRKGGRKLRKNFFPYKLMAILSNPCYSDLIRWIHHGKSFVITNQNSFVEEVLQKCFNRNVKIEGFTRKLNRWGFRMITKGPDCGAYFNSLFLRDQPELCEMMACQKNGGYETLTKQVPIAQPKEQDVDHNIRVKAIHPVEELQSIDPADYRETDAHCHQDHTEVDEDEDEFYPNLEIVPDMEKLIYHRASQAVLALESSRLSESRKLLQLSRLLSCESLHTPLLPTRSELYLAKLLYARGMTPSLREITQYHNIIMKDAVLALTGEVERI